MRGFWVGLMGLKHNALECQTYIPLLCKGAVRQPCNAMHKEFYMKLWLSTTNAKNGLQVQLELARMHSATAPALWAASSNTSAGLIMINTVCSLIYASLQDQKHLCSKHSELVQPARCASGLSVGLNWQGRAGQGRAGRGGAGQGRAGQGRAGQGRAGQGRAGQGRAGQGRACEQACTDLQP